jgi:nitrite reductase/ring-hydroxylating ferredoxin subunit
VIDYIYAVPPNSSGKTRATRHAIGNVTALLLFLASWFLREPDQAMGVMTLVLEVVGAGVLAYSGMLGGELVVRNMISVDHRYADKGRWKEEDFTAKVGDSIRVATEDELGTGHMKLLWVNGQRIALARTAGGYCAFQDSCTHRGASLAGGVLIGETVHCLWHGSQFNVVTGQIECGPAKEKIKLFQTRVRDGEVMLVVP